MPENNLDSDKAPLRMSKGQISRSALYSLNGKILEECNRDLRWPYCMNTYKKMFKDSTIAPALNLMEMSISKVKWEIKIPEGYEEELKEKADFLRSVMNDMEHSWYDFIKRSSTFNRFGFAPVEKVYRRRLKSRGSKYDDGLIGLESLPLIDQDSVAQWEFDEAGRHLTGLRQWDRRPKGPDNFEYTYTYDPTPIPRKKFLLFRADPIKNNPEGNSPLNGVYVAWRFKTELEKFESMGVSQDLRGLKVLKIPARYMSEEADEAEKQTYDAFQRQIANIHKGEQSGIIIPSDMDDQGKPMFDFKLESVMGQSTYNVHEIISRWRKEIITGLLCQQLILGQDGSGSFALAEQLQGATGAVIDARLREIRDQLNHDLIPQLFALNGWDITNTPYFDFEDFQESNLDDFSKSVQRIASVGGMVLNAETINQIHEKLGLSIPFDDINIDIEDVREMASNFQSNAGEGMETGTSGNGTAKSAASRDNSSANLSN